MRLRTKLLLPILAVSALMTVTSLLVIGHSARARITEEINESLSNSAKSFEDLQRHRESDLRHSAQLVANGPVLKAVMATQDPLTIQDASQSIWQMSGASLLVLANPAGQVMAVHVTGRGLEAKTAQSLFFANSVQSGGVGSPGWWFAEGRLYEISLQPIVSDSDEGQQIFRGTLAIGNEVDREVATEIGRIAAGKVAFRYGGHIVLSTLDLRQQEQLDAVLERQPNLPAVSGEPFEASLGGERFLSKPVQLSPGSQAAPQLILLQSYDRATVLLRKLNILIIAVGGAAILLGGTIVFAISHTLTKPLEGLVTGVRALGAGDFAYPVHGNGHDEIAELTGAFESMRLNLQASQQRLVTSARLEAVGQLAGGVAHDFNNIITIIRGYSELMAGVLDPEDALFSYAQQIIKAGDRASSLTRQLLAFSRKQVLEPQVLDLNSTVSNMSKMLKMLIGEHIDVEYLQPRVLRRVLADAGNVEQVLLNLAVNARDAMPQGGKILIETENCDVKQPVGSIEGEVPPGKYVRLSVSDTGCGMDAQTQRKIFQPFFTTKEAGKGTGLGLAIVYGVVKQSGGFLQLESQLGLGSTFRILLPEAAETPDLPDDVLPHRAAPRGTETVLVVEDEDAVRDLVRESLELHGYTVIEAKHGEEALEILKKRGPDVDLVLTDLVMPKMGGIQLAETLRTVAPVLKVLFMSGHTDKWAEIEQLKIAFLHKPFTPEILAHKVRETLSAGQATV